MGPVGLWGLYDVLPVRSCLSEHAYCSDYDELDDSSDAPENPFSRSRSSVRMTWPRPANMMFSEVTLAALHLARTAGHMLQDTRLILETVFTTTACRIVILHRRSKKKD